MNTTANDLQPKPFKRRGTTYEPKNTQGTYNAEVLPGVSIRIFGVMTNHVKGPQSFDRVFQIGDKAEYASWNMSYVGTIVKIAGKTVTVRHDDCGGHNVTMLDLYTFVDRNWDFDAVKIAKRNSEWMD